MYVVVPPDAPHATHGPAQLAATLVDLVSERVGGAALVASDEFFAEKENLVRASDAVWAEGRYTDRGKWMDGWESRRKRVAGHDWCILKLGLPGRIRYVEVDTKFFRGNFPEACALEAAALEGDPTPAEVASDGVAWTEVLARAELRGHSRNVFDVASDRRWTHVRLNIFPDGGVARLRLWGDVLPDWRRVLRQQGGSLDLAAVENGGRVLGANNDFFGRCGNLIVPGRAANMGDGWETRRRRPPLGSDWAVLRLAARGTIQSIEVDTNHFKGNFPDACMIEGGTEASDLSTDPTRPAPEGEAAGWTLVLPRTPLRAHARHVFLDEIVARGPFTHLRLHMFPDGGISRLRVHGTVDEATALALRLAWLDALPEGAARAALRACCGSSRWVDGMARGRPFGGPEALFEAAERAADALAREDWLEAFAAHPRIGSRKDVAVQGAATRGWTEQEQAGMSAAEAEVKAAIAAGNEEYERRFGHIYIVCATGRSAREMLEILRARLANDAAAELAVASGEQRKITRIRLEKLLRS
jgi:allantoicase